MASPNVELVRQLFHDWNYQRAIPRDELLAPDFEFHSPLADERGEPYRGAAGARQWVTDLNERYGSFAFELDELEERGELILALGRIEVEGLGTAPGMTEPAGWLIEIRDGRFRRMEMFTNVEAARAAFADRAQATARAPGHRGRSA
jgi:ketosteroid isomerase-like protein